MSPVSSFRWKAIFTELTLKLRVQSHMFELGNVSYEKSSRSQYDDPEYGITVTRVRFGFISSPQSLKTNISNRSWRQSQIKSRGNHRLSLFRLNIGLQEGFILCLMLYVLLRTTTFICTLLSWERSSLFLIRWALTWT